MCDYNDYGDGFASECLKDLLSDDQIINDVYEATVFQSKAKYWIQHWRRMLLMMPEMNFFESLVEDIGCGWNGEKWQVYY